MSWETNTTIDAIARRVRTWRRVVVLTHQKPDGDAAGSTLAVTRALNLAAGVQVATPWYFGPLPDWMPGLARATSYRVIDGGAGPDPLEPDGIIILDTGSWSQLDQVEDWLRARADRAVAIDHHRQGDVGTAALRVVQTRAAAAAEPAAELCRLILGKSSARELPVEVAEPLYLGLATDTGWFRHSNTSGAALRLAADLLDAGVEHAALYEAIEQQDRPSRLWLLARAMASLELHDHDRIALMSLTQQDFHDTHATPNDSTGFTTHVLAVGSVRVAAVFTEAHVEPGAAPLTKASLRSKDGPGAIDVSAIAHELGGGGHVRAAGVRAAGTLPEIKAKVLAAIRRAMDPGR